MSRSPMRISLSVKGVEVNLCLGNRKHRFFFTTRLRGWYLSASLRLGTGTNLPPSPTCLTKLLVAAANILRSRRHRLRPSSNEPIFEEESQMPNFTLCDVKSNYADWNSKACSHQVLYRCAVHNTASLHELPSWIIESVVKGCAKSESKWERPFTAAVHKTNSNTLPVSLRRPQLGVICHQQWTSWQGGFKSCGKGIVFPVDVRPGYHLQGTGSKRNSFMRPAGEFWEQKSTFESSQDTHHYTSISLLWDLACL